MSDTKFGALGQSLLGLGGDLLGGIGGAMLQNHYAQAAWRQQMEYNKPVNQMKRLKEAGLNPNLVYGNGTVANTMDMAKIPEVRSSDIGSKGIGQYNAVKTVQLTNEQIAAQTEYYKKLSQDKTSQINFREMAQLPKVMQELEGVGLSNKQKQMFLDTYMQNFTVGQEQKKAQTQSLLQQTLYSKALTSKINQELKYYPEKVQAEIKQIFHNINSTDASSLEKRTNASYTENKKSLESQRFRLEQLKEQYGDKGGIIESLLKLLKF